jgi:alcohol dehydrogenase class IV
MPRTLRDVGVREDQLQLVSEYTLEDIWGRTNPRTIATPSDVMGILQTAMG